MEQQDERKSSRTKIKISLRVKLPIKHTDISLRAYKNTKN